MQGDPAFHRRSRWEKLDDAARCGFCGRDGGHHNVGHHMDGLARLSGQEAIKNVAPSPNDVFWRGRAGKGRVLGEGVGEALPVTKVIEVGIPKDQLFAFVLYKHTV